MAPAGALAAGRRVFIPAPTAADRRQLSPRYPVGVARWRDHECRALTAERGR